MTDIRITVNDQTFTAQLADNPTAHDLIDQLPLTLRFRDFNHVEKIAKLPRPLTMVGSHVRPAQLASESPDSTSGANIRRLTRGELRKYRPRALSQYGPGHAGIDHDPIGNPDHEGGRRDRHPDHRQ